MAGLFDFIAGIGTAISALFNFVVSLIQDIVYMVQLTGKFVAQLPQFFTWLPDAVQILIGITFSIVVVYKVIGREG